MSKRKIIAFSLTSIVVVSLFSSWWYLNYSMVPRSDHYDPTSETQEEQPSQYVTISVNLYEKNTQWVRDYVTDLPYCSSTIIYSISNHGTASASDVEYTIYVNDNIYWQDTISTLASQTSHSDQFSIQVDYDDQCQISLFASCGDSSDRCDFVFEAILPRSPESVNLKKLFITPDDPIVRNTVDNIMRNKFILYPGWMAIKDWVAGEIEYSYDSTSHGTRNYWQLPRETILSGSGDCEDFSILMVSLLRAAGWSVNEAYVVVGCDTDGCHAWVRLNVDIIGWQNLEPQSGTIGWLLLGDYFWLGSFEDVYGFNDVDYEAL
ncbi:MAG: transglutaminase-like cysteine peptidase [Candidatus Bathyarchaeota archaeon]|nr:transglutaminase-like cysteine peptidase [Candidatus Bathyarchaeota archaeon]